MKKTVFILGAGASRPFGLPTGLELRRQILAVCAEHLQEVSLCFGCGKREVQEFAQAFRRSGARSIDTFLEDNPELQPIGKFLIAAVIMPREHDAIANDLICEDWMSWLLNTVKNAEHLLHSGTISFITFNYDRLLEAAVYQYFRYQRHKADEAAWDATIKCTILHVYGQLDDDVHAVLHGDRNPFGRMVAYQRAAEAMGEIRIISDQRDGATQPVLEKCKGLVKGADAIVCLGFGFDRTNMIRIGLQGSALPEQMVPRGTGSSFEMKPAVEVMASAYGMHDAERRVAARLLGDPRSVHLGKPNHGCEDMLRDLCSDFLSQWYCVS